MSFCKACNTESHPDDLLELDGELFCWSCRRDSLFGQLMPECSECQALSSTHEIYLVNGKYMCLSCAAKFSDIFRRTAHTIDATLEKEQGGNPLFCSLCETTYTHISDMVSETGTCIYCIREEIIDKELLEVCTKCGGDCSYNEVCIRKKKPYCYDCVQQFKDVQQAMSNELNNNPKGDLTMTECTTKIESYLTANSRLKDIITQEQTVFNRIRQEVEDIVTDVDQYSSIQYASEEEILAAIEIDTRMDRLYSSLLKYVTGRTKLSIELEAEHSDYTDRIIHAARLQPAAIHLEGLSRGVIPADLAPVFEEMGAKDVGTFPSLLDKREAWQANRVASLKEDINSYGTATSLAQYQNTFSIEEYPFLKRMFQAHAQHLVTELEALEQEADTATQQLQEAANKRE